MIVFVILPFNTNKACFRMSFVQCVKSNLFEHSLVPVYMVGLHGRCKALILKVLNVKSLLLQPNGPGTRLRAENDSHFMQS